MKKKRLTKTVINIKPFKKDTSGSFKEKRIKQFVKENEKM